MWYTIPMNKKYSKRGKSYMENTKYIIYFRNTNDNDKTLKDGYVKSFNTEQGTLELTRKKSECMQPMDSEAECRAALLIVKRLNTNPYIRFMPLKITI